MIDHMKDRNIRLCPYCNAEVTIDDYQCPKCGATLIWSQYVEQVALMPHHDNQLEHQTDDHLVKKELG